MPHWLYSPPWQIVFWRCCILYDIYFRFQQLQLRVTTVKCINKLIIVVLCLTGRTTFCSLRLSYSRLIKLKFHSFMLRIGLYFSDTVYFHQCSRWNYIRSAIVPLASSTLRGSEELSSPTYWTHWQLERTLNLALAWYAQAPWMRKPLFSALFSIILVSHLTKNLVLV